MYVVATAGHVDHGKSTLVRALTGMEPDRWAEERRRGMTLDLGYAWTTLPTGETLAFVDVPGHRRFIGNMLAGLGPAPAVVVVVAADEGWREQTTEHLAAVDALGLTRGLVVITRSDLADPASARAQAAERLAASTLCLVETVAVSGVTGAGLDDLRAALHRLVRDLPAPDGSAPVRMWVDRSFTVRGAGTVVTGTLGAGRLAVGDTLHVRGRDVAVRGLQALNAPTRQAEAVSRVAVNLRAVASYEVGRGDVLLSPGAWASTEDVDVELFAPWRTSDAVLHVGTAAVPVRVRPLGDPTTLLARLSLTRALPLTAGDRAILRDASRRTIVGVRVLDVDPPPLRRRGAARARAGELGAHSAAVARLRRCGAVRRTDPAAVGLAATADARVVGEWLVDSDRWEQWQAELTSHVDAHRIAQPLQPGLPVAAAQRALAVPERELVHALAAAVGPDGRGRRPGTTSSLGPAEAGLATLQRRLTEQPFAAADRTELQTLGLHARELATAVALGRLVQLADGVVLLPDAPARAVTRLAEIRQPFTLSEARQALSTTRRVAVPLLEHLDARGETVRVDADHRRVSSNATPRPPGGRFA